MKTILALYGAGRKSLLAAQCLLAREPDIVPKYLIENNDFSKMGNEIPLENSDYGLKVISLAEFSKLYQAGECQKVLVPAAYHIFDLREIRGLLQGRRIKAEDIWAMSYNRLFAPHDAEGPGLESYVQFDLLEQLFHVDIHIVDHCNLSCEACAHFNNLVKESVIYPAEQVLSSLRRLKELCPSVTSFAILGGGPLLHPEWRKIVSCIRDIFPFSSIDFVTNALLAKKLNAQDAALFKQSRVNFSISLYPPLQNSVDTLVAHLRKIELPFKMTRIDYFERRLIHEKKFSAQRQHKKCGHDHCLRGTKIGYCVIALFTDYFNDYFDESKLPEDAGVDLFAVSSGRDLIDKLSSPLELCKQCVGCEAGKLFWKPWEKSQNPQPSDWWIEF